MGVWNRVPDLSFAHHKPSSTARTSITGTESVGLGPEVSVCLAELRRRETGAHASCSEFRVNLYARVQFLCSDALSLEYNDCEHSVYMVGLHCSNLCVLSTSYTPIQRLDPIVCIHGLRR